MREFNESYKLVISYFFALKKTKNKNSTIQAKTLIFLLEFTITIPNARQTVKFIKEYKLLISFFTFHS